MAHARRRGRGDQHSRELQRSSLSRPPATKGIQVEISRRQVLRGLGVSALAATVARAGLLPAASADAKSAPNSPLGPAQSLDNRPFPAYDYSRANKLPSEMTGYWVKSFDVSGSVRTAKVYISPE